jgi:hypothetical protein
VGAWARRAPVRAPVSWDTLCGVEGGEPTHVAIASPSSPDQRHPRKREARESDESHGKLVDLSAFQRDILPLIQNIPLSRLQKGTGLSLRYVSLIRRGERTPHPRHWQALIGAGPRRERNLSRSRKLFWASGVQ